MRAASTPERARWAAGLGLDDDAGDDGAASSRLADLVVDGDVADDAFPARAGRRVGRRRRVRRRRRRRRAGADGLPDGIEAGRAGMAGDVGVRTWSDGRAWIAVRATDEWPGGRLFGLRRASSCPSTSARRHRVRRDRRHAVALHGDDIDVVVEGSVGADVLRQVAGVARRRRPSRCPDPGRSSNDVVADAAIVAADDLLVLHGVDGFGEPAVRIDGGEVLAALRRSRRPRRRGRAQRGDRAAAAARPRRRRRDRARARPAAGDAATGDLEWVEGGHVRVLRSPTLPLDELLALADGLGPP